MDLLIFFLFSSAGYLVFKYLKTPAPALLGAITAIGLAGCVGGLELSVPGFVKPVLSVILGCIIGMQLNIEIRHLWKEALLSTAWIIFISTFTAKILSFTGLRESTAVFASLPAGIAEVTLVGMSFGVDPFEVALLQSSRIIFTCTLIPFLVKKLQRPDDTPVFEKKGGVPVKPCDWLAFAVISLMVSQLFGISGIPAPYLIGSLTGAAVYTKARNLAIPNLKGLQTFGQLGVGGLIGLNVSQAGLLAVPHFLPFIVLLNICLVGSGLLLSYYLHRVKGWDWTTCILATAPAGLTPMTVLALEMKADVTKVMILQVLRMVSVIMFAPLAGYLSL